MLFSHDWTVNDPLAQGDGLGPVYNATSCAECHSLGGTGGGGHTNHNVTVYGLVHPHPRGLPQSGVVHQKAVARTLQETLDLVHPSLPHRPSIPLSVLTDRKAPRLRDVVITQRNTPALFGAGLLDGISDDVIIASERAHSAAARLVGLAGARDRKIKGRVARLADGSIGRFGWKLEFASLGSFVKAACANELGLSNPGRPQATPLGKLDYQPKGVDLTEEQCTMMTEFIRSLPRPVEAAPDDRHVAAIAGVGKDLFRSIGCADCHSESLGNVNGCYSDMLLHDLGADLESSSGGYDTVPSPPVPNERFSPLAQPSPLEWRTAPLWGVADSAPYLHDGRASTLDAAITAHRGEAEDVTARFNLLSEQQRHAILTFLQTLKAPAADSGAPYPSVLAAR
jgi:CxxC motif-containing protein (DUF1111 family)